MDRTTSTPQTETIDLRNMQDPVSVSDNAIAQQVAKLQGQPQQLVDQRSLQEQEGVRHTRRAGYEQPAEQYNQTLQNTAPQQEQDPWQGVDLSDPSAESELLQDFLTPQQQEQPQQTEEVPDKEYTAFAEQFQKYMGINLQDAVATFNELQQFRTEQAVERQLNAVAQQWGVERTEAEARLQQVRERFSKLDPQTQDILARDQVRATQLIWSQLEREQVAKQQRVPAFDRNSQQRPSTLPPGVLLKSQIDAMSESEYKQNLPLITQAYATGKVINDISQPKGRY